jgi:hypothetical protein
VSFCGGKIFESECFLVGKFFDGTRKYILRNRKFSCGGKIFESDENFAKKAVCFLLGNFFKGKTI